MQTHWWENFFLDPMLGVLQREKNETQTKTDADFIEKLLSLPPGASVLDVPSGDGHLCVELASRGYRITGVESSQPRIEGAERWAGERHMRVEWKHQDPRYLPWRNLFDGVLCLWGNFGYFDDVGNADFLMAVYRVLKPGCSFLVSAPIVETLLPRMQERNWSWVGDVLVLEEQRYNHVTSRLEREWTLLHEGHTERRQLSTRIYTYRELCSLLQEAGFECSGYSTLSQEDFMIGASVLYMVATKKE